MFQSLLPPYNWQITPAPLFYGRHDIVEEMVNGLLSGTSYGLVGGSKMGKTTLLRMIEKQIKEKQLNWLNGGLFVTCIYLNLSSWSNNFSSNDIFAFICDCIQDEAIRLKINNQEIIPKDKTINHYSHPFASEIVAYLATIRDCRTQIVILFDEPSLILNEQWGTTFFANWRSFLSNTPQLSPYISAVFADTNKLDKLAIRDGSPLSNILEIIELEIFDEYTTESFVNEPTGGNFEQGLSRQIFKTSGGHPFLIQYLMYYICREKQGSPLEHLRVIEKRFLEKQQTHFERWWSELNSLAQEVYKYLIHEKQPVHRRELVEKMGRNINQALRNLTSTGIVYWNREEDEFMIAGSLFQKWFEQRSGNYTDGHKRDANRQLRIGELLPQQDGRYEIVEVVASRHDSNSFVYKAIDHKLAQRMVAIKEPIFFYDKDRMPEKTFKKLFIRYQNEMAIISRLRHSFVAQAYDFVADRYLIQEWVEGDSLRDIINKKKKLIISEVLKIAIQACSALGHFYEKRKVVHRDIKPEHIFLCGDKNIRIIDFGLVQAKGLSSITYSPLSLQEEELNSGTLPYMAPEQSFSKVDHRADIFALGMTLYELLTHKWAYPRGAWGAFYTKGVVPAPAPIRKIRPDVSSTLEGIILKSINLDPKRRHNTWEDFEDSLLEIQKSLNSY